MPVGYLKSLSEKHNIPIEQLETLWEKAKVEAGEDFKKEICHCVYSKSMNQPYPRLCIYCGKPEEF